MSLLSLIGKELNDRVKEISEKQIAAGKISYTVKSMNRKKCIFIKGEATKTYRKPYIEKAH